MTLQKQKGKVRCDMGSCKNRADYVIKLDRMGIKSTINVCSDCLNELYSLIGGEVVPKSIETASRVRERIKAEDVI